MSLGSSLVLYRVPSLISIGSNRLTEPGSCFSLHLYSLCVRILQGLHMDWRPDALVQSMKNDSSGFVSLHLQQVFIVPPLSRYARLVGFPEW